MDVVESVDATAVVRRIGGWTRGRNREDWVRERVDGVCFATSETLVK